MFNEQCIWAEMPLPSIITSITSTWVWWALWHSPKLRIYGYSLTWKAPWWQAGQVIDTITAGNLSGQLLQIRNPTCHYLIWRLDWDLGCALLECALLAAVSNISRQKLLRLWIYFDGMRSNIVLNFCPGLFCCSTFDSQTQTKDFLQSEKC